MKFIRETPSAVTIRHVEKGRLIIGEESLTGQVLLFPDGIDREWRPQRDRELGVGDLDAIVARGPEILLLGTGWESRLPPRDVTFALARRGIGFESMDTAAACRTFNILVAEDRYVAAFLLID